ncbi:MAG: tRNA epoxyqueuosine(34) reductase QueG [Planctomycetota bacterium]|nr:tRNA epoxyqueuosine(34) reductase QueG [Planctomycetota bacterium]
MDPREEHRALIERLAMEAGFARSATLALADLPPEQAFADWLVRGWEGEMNYLHRHRNLRLAPSSLVPGATGVICLAASYAAAPPAPIARYARGRDYHKVLKARCRRLMDCLRDRLPGFAGRAFVDAGPVGERHLAAAAGLGWIGRNGCLHVPGLGSYVLLAEIFCNLALPTGGPMPAPCGPCQACLIACPTGALAGSGQVDARRCLSYLTIEHKGPIDGPLAARWGDRIFGCDACQEACPHNQTVLPGDDELTSEYWLARGAPGPLAGAGAREIARWTLEDWSAATAGSAIRRASLEQLQRNAALAVGAMGQEMGNSLKSGG